MMRRKTILFTLLSAALLVSLSGYLLGFPGYLSGVLGVAQEGSANHVMSADHDMSDMDANMNHSSGDCDMSDMDH